MPDSDLSSAKVHLLPSGKKDDPTLMCWAAEAAIAFYHAAKLEE
jgi:hypothetical protein